MLIATEVFIDRAALERQQSHPEVAKTLGILEESVAAEPEAMIFHVSSAECGATDNFLAGLDLISIGHFGRCWGATVSD